MDFEQWKGFEKGEWKRKIDVRNFIQKNYTPYEGNATFLTGTTEKTKKLWEVLDSKKNNFSVSFPMAIEKSFALGTIGLDSWFNKIQININYFLF